LRIIAADCRRMQTTQIQDVYGHPPAAIVGVGVLTAPSAQYREAAQSGPPEKPAPTGRLRWVSHPPGGAPTRSPDRATARCPCR
jgi:hypothetical protein